MIERVLRRCDWRVVAKGARSSAPAAPSNFFYIFHRPNNESARPLDRAFPLCVAELALERSDSELSDSILYLPLHDVV